MMCVICKTGTTAPGTTTATLDKDVTVVVIRRVPADVCTTCGEAYYDAATTRRLLELATAARESGAELQLRSTPPPEPIRPLIDPVAHPPCPLCRKPIDPGGDRAPHQRSGNHLGWLARIPKKP